MLCVGNRRHPQVFTSEIYELGRTQIGETIHDIMDNFHSAANAFKDFPKEDQEFMQIFSFICLLSFDIYLKKEVIEKMLDALPKQASNKKSGESRSKRTS